MRVTVLGASGMLGHVVAQFLAEAGHAIRCPEIRFRAESPDEFLDALQSTRPEAVVNCIGIRAGATAQLLTETHVHLVAQAIRRLDAGVRFIQASTDGIFRPDQPSRRAEESGDAADDYGRSKWEAERQVIMAGGCAIRCSILGPELKSSKSLMEWFLNQRGPVRGFVNHAWNGITTLEWARICNGLLEAGSPPPVCQPGFWPAMSKAEVLELIAEVWDRSVEIRPEAAPEPVHRTLLPNIVCPPLALQLRNLRIWHATRFAEAAGSSVAGEPA